MAKRGQPPGVYTDGRLLREAREAVGLSREALCARPDVDLCARTIQTAERGGPVSMVSARNLAMVLNLPYMMVVRPGPELVRRRLREAGRAPEPPPSPWADRPEVAAVLDVVTRRKGTGVVCVTGLPGAGKTALARYVAERVTTSFPEGAVWVAGGKRSVVARPRDVHLELAAARGFDARLESIPEDDHAAFLPAFLHHFWAGRRCLMVLDDVLSIGFARQFLPPRGEGSAIVVTMQRDIAEALSDEVVHLGDLDEREAWRLLASYIGEERLVRDPEGTRALLHIVSGLPRGLHIAGSVLRRELYTTPGGYAARIECDPNELADNRETVGVVDSWGVRQWSQVASIEGLRRLVSASAWEMFGWLGVFGELQFSLGWAAGLAGVTTSEAGRRLAELENVFLIERALAPAGEVEAEPQFRIEAHVAAYARWRSQVGLLLAHERLADVAVQRAQVLAELPEAEGRTALRRDRDVWRFVLGQLTEEVARGVDEPIGAIAIRMREGDVAAAAGPLALVQVLLSVRRILGCAGFPGARHWAMAAYAVAGSRGMAAEQGLLAGMVALTLAHDPAARVPWLVAAARLLEAAGNAHDGAEACYDLGHALIDLGRVDEACAALDRSLHLARAAGQRPLELARRLNEVGAAHARAAHLAHRAATQAEEAFAAALGLAVAAPVRVPVVESILRANRWAVRLARSDDDGHELRDELHVLLASGDVSDVQRASASTLAAQFRVPLAEPPLERARREWEQALNCDGCEAAALAAPLLAVSRDLERLTAKDGPRVPRFTAVGEARSEDGGPAAGFVVLCALDPLAEVFEGSLLDGARAIVGLVFGDESRSGRALAAVAQRQALRAEP